MDKIDNQRVPAEKIQRCKAPAEQLLSAVTLDDAPEEKAQQEDENPRDYREVVRRAEAAVRKAEEGYVLELIEKVGHTQQLDVEKSYVPLGHSVENREAQQRQKCAEKGIDFVEQLSQQSSDKHSAADEIEHAEPHRLLGHYQSGHKCNQQAAEVYYQSAPYRVVRKMQRHARNQYEADTDEPLPYDDPRVCEPNGVESVYRENIVAEVIYYHVHEREAAERVNQPVAVRIILFHIS